MTADGKWNIGWKVGRGSRAATVELAIAGSALTGTFGNGGGANAQPIVDGAIDGEKLTWKVETRDFSGPLVMNFEATVNGDRIEGTIQTPFEVSPFTGLRG